ncbi:hypothetical protein Pint_35171 [Pistacia integerrima]|uniref:Uncharacterized protein n=1 Tax=Pistacia integerrima TaxID=434235 RepID=A0ACC0Y3B3_9ROSI|nr:hypothetical protein Pint_35171 [Pistacia integerrima]
MGDFNLALVIVAIVVCVLVFIFNVYLLVNYQHPDDANQAYFPKFVVVLGLSIAAISILMLPADVANRQACSRSIYNGACNLTLPMKNLWLAIYILDAVLVSVGKRIKSALLWVIMTAIVCALVLGILYGLVGKVDFTVRHLSSATTNFPSTWDFSSSQQCIGSGAHQVIVQHILQILHRKKHGLCALHFQNMLLLLLQLLGLYFLRFLVVLALLVCHWDLSFHSFRRPKAVITRSQYIKEATELGKKAKELKKAADALHQEERSGSKGRKWRKNVKAVEKELLQLEEDVKLLEEMYPQGEKAETSWALTVLGYLAKLVLGIIGLIVSVAWVAHIVIYLLINPPLHPFLNEVFIKLDDLWGLLGTAAFAFFCFYLLLAVIAGGNDAGSEISFHYDSSHEVGSHTNELFSFQCGSHSPLFNQVGFFDSQIFCFNIMYSFMLWFNKNLVFHSNLIGLLFWFLDFSVIQFCATAFGYYAQATAAQEIFGHTLQSLRGIRYLYKYNVFQIAFIVLAGLTFVYYAAFVRMEKKKTKWQVPTVQLRYVLHGRVCTHRGASYGLIAVFFIVGHVWPSLVVLNDLAM